MPDLEEAPGDAVTGGVAAHAVGANEAVGHTHEHNCLNCGCELVGDFCHCCGQKAHVHRTLGAFWHDLLHGVLHFEGKIWRTLPMLAWRPGVLTRRYIHGERAKFVSPIALFLFSVFLMFAVVSAFGGPFTFSGSGDERSRVRLQQEYEQAETDARAEIAELREERRALLARGQPTREVEARMRSVDAALDLQRSLLVGGRQAAADEETLSGLVQVDSGDATGVLGWFNAAYRKAKQNPSLLLYKLQANAYKFSWALIPLSVPFVWLLFLHRARYRRFGPYDHTVFVTYSIGFMSLAWLAFVILDKSVIPNRALGVAALIVPPIHMYRQLRGAYGLSRLSAAWRTVALLTFAFICLGLFLLMLIGIGVM